MEELVEIIGGRSLSGAVKVSGAKNAVLPMLIASLLTPETCTFTNVPSIRDVFLTIDLLKQFGAEVTYKEDKLESTTFELAAREASYSLVKAFRASFWILGPLLARGGAARVALPGGDIIGARPVDLHISALELMGADIQVKGGVVYATAPNGLHGAEIDLRFPSVGATHQVLLAASLVSQKTVLKGAAKEPEVVALAKMLSEMGAKINGAGTSIIEIEGAPYLKGVQSALIGDRIEAATYLLAAVATRSKIRVEGFDPQNLGAFTAILKEMGAVLNYAEDGLEIDATGDLRPVNVATGPFPEFATDMQALLMAALTNVPGESSITENIFEGRFGHVAEYCRLGAKVEVVEKQAIIHGVSRLSGAPVQGLDIRAAAGLVVAGLAAEGKTSIYEPFHLGRGYDGMVEKLRSLGANICQKITDPEDFMGVGC